LWRSSWPLFSVAASPTLAGNARSASPETIICLNSPATNFIESSPMGNGRLGAMLFGGVDQETNRAQ